MTITIIHATMKKKTEYKLEIYNLPKQSLTEKL